jgi:hypothetical protein
MQEKTASVFPVRTSHSRGWARNKQEHTEKIIYIVVVFSDWDISVSPADDKQKSIENGKRHGMDPVSSIPQR